MEEKASVDVEEDVYQPLALRASWQDHSMTVYHVWVTSGGRATGELRKQMKTMKIMKAQPKAKKKKKKNNNGETVIINQRGGILLWLAASGVWRRRNQHLQLARATAAARPVARRARRTARVKATNI